MTWLSGSTVISQRHFKIVLVNILSQRPAVVLTTSRSSSLKGISPLSVDIDSSGGVICVIPFLKGKANIVESIREDAPLADWWVEQEDYASEVMHVNAGWKSQFRKEYSYRDLIATSKQQRTLDDFLPDVGAVDRFCTDCCQPSAMRRSEIWRSVAFGSIQHSASLVRAESMSVWLGVVLVSMEPI